MGSVDTLKFFSMVCAIFLFLNSIFSLINKTTPPGQKQYPNQNVIISIMYMMMAIILFFSAMNLDKGVSMGSNY